MKSTPSINVILVHGAWADGSSWSGVIRRLQALGSRVIAAPIPLTSLGDDIAALQSAIERTEGPVVLAAHAYAGAVISGVESPRIEALCFIAALTPQEDETVAEVFYREQPHPQAPKLAPDPRGFIWLPEDAFGAAFAQNAPREQIGVLAAAQRPIAVPCIQQRATRAGWKSTPSWYLIAEEDRMINPATQRFLAERMGAKARAHRVDHTPMVTAPDLVTEVILDAARATSETAHD